MNRSTLLLRQAHPNFIQDGVPVSLVFTPTSSDNGQLSVYDSDLITPANSYKHYTENRQSAGVWAVSVEEAHNLDVKPKSDPLEGNPSHALIDFNDPLVRSEKDLKKIAKKLLAEAQKRGRLHPPA